MDIKEMYDAIIEVNYDHWIVENDISGTSFEQFRMEVDITYREQFSSTTSHFGTYKWNHDSTKLLTSLERIT